MRRTPALLVLAAACWPSAAPAQPAPATPPPKEIVLRPAAPPVPALKYRLVPEARTLVPGNAAVFYHRGILLLMQKRSAIAASAARPGAAAAPDRVDEQALGQWSYVPIAEIPRDKARRQLDAFEGALKEVELGAQREDCDWEFDRRAEGITLLLPEIQEMRSLARLVALRARLAVLDGKTDEAVHWIEVGLTVGRHVSQGPVVIQALVGIAIDMVMVQCLEDLIQAPGTPSLYWALADRPRPFIDMGPSLEGERYMLEKELPGLAELDRGVWSQDHARRFADELQRKLFSFDSGEQSPGAGGGAQGDLAGLTRRLGVAGMAAKVYPVARRALVARGRPESRVEAMPVVQVAALYCMQEYERHRDDYYKWMNLPYWQSYGRPDTAALAPAGEKLANPLLTMFQMAMPALNSVRLAALRPDRQLDVLQCVEAVRLYAHAHGGQLPPTLEALADAPVPLDVATGKPFHYEVKDGTALLSAPVPPGANHPSYAIRYVLKPAK